jgi:hypothetical protein
MEQKFIKTNDASTIAALIKLGFQQVDNSDGYATFLNTDKLQFSDDIDKSKIHYSNMLCI